MKPIKLSQAYETPLQLSENEAGLNYRYVYSRSADCLVVNQPGEDYLTWYQEGQQFVFVLADGVSQSFFGGLAAQILGDALLEWLWDNHDKVDQVDTFLQNLTVHATIQIQNHPLPSDLALMHQQVLEQKRALGSQSTFCGGYLDLATQQLFLVWMGDSRLRLWSTAGKEEDLGDTFRTSERWCSRQGLIGKLHTQTYALNELSRLWVYSDGLATLDRYNEVVSQATLQEIISRVMLSPTSDDLSLLEVFLGELPTKKLNQPVMLLLEPLAVEEKPLPVQPVNFPSQPSSLPSPFEKKSTIIEPRPTSPQTSFQWINRLFLFLTMIMGLCFCTIIVVFYWGMVIANNKMTMDKENRQITSPSPNFVTTTPNLVVTSQVTDAIKRTPMVNQTATITPTKVIPKPTSQPVATTVISSTTSFNDQMEIKPTQIRNSITTRFNTSPLPTPTNQGLKKQP